MQDVVNGFQSEPPGNKQSGFLLKRKPEQRKLRLLLLQIKKPFTCLLSRLFPIMSIVLKRRIQCLSLC